MRTSLFGIAATLAALMASTTTALEIATDIETLDNLEIDDDFNFAELEGESEGEDGEKKDVAAAIVKGHKATAPQYRKGATKCEGTPTLKDMIAAFKSGSNGEITKEDVYAQRCTPCFGRVHTIDRIMLQHKQKELEAAGKPSTAGVNLLLEDYYKKRCGVLPFRGWMTGSQNDETFESGLKRNDPQWMEKHGGEPKKIKFDEKEFARKTAAGAKSYQKKVDLATKIKARRAANAK